MGKRSRKRDRDPRPVERVPGAEPAPAPPVPRAPQRRPRREDRPKAPWDPFPLVELCVLVGLVFIVIGLLGIEGARGQILLLLGLVLASLAGLDTVVREHFAGFRSHTTVLAGFPAVTAAGVCYFARVPVVVVLIVAAAVFVVGLSIFRAAFQRRAGVAWR